MEETEEPPSSVCGEAEDALHQEVRKSLPGDSENDEEPSHENE